MLHEPAITAAVPRSAAFVERLGALLSARGLIDAPALARARRAQGQSGERFDVVLMRLGLVSDTAMAAVLADLSGLPLVAGDAFPAAPILPERLQLAFLEAHHVLPLDDDGERLRLAVADPYDDEVPRALAFLLDRAVRCVVAAEGEIDRAIARLYGEPARGRDGAAAGAAAEAVSGDGADQAVSGTASGTASGSDDVRRLADMASEAPVIKQVRDLVVRAVEAQASDIHIEPREDSLLVRYRIDGLLHTVETLAPALAAPVGSRIKIMARLNIAERRLPQDGRIKETVRGREIDLRVSTMPTMWGESIVLRILDRASVELDFVRLGFSGPPYQAFTRMLDEPNGIILVTGPTGSGKTTTLYTALGRLNNAERKIFTVEDPIEYQLVGINQIQVQPRIGMTFAHALRSILRQDPDIIMVGEIRDLETAQIAIQAALTGHLVLSTVHTNSAAATVTRLIDMGVEKYLLASCLKGVLAQRLVRRLCPSCAAPQPVSGALREVVRAAGVREPVAGLGHDEPWLPRRAVGCPACRGKGFAGRTTVYELLPMTDAVREAMMGADADQAITRAAVRDGMQTMLQNGLEKAMRGETTPEEVMRVTRFDGWLDTATRPTTSTDS